MNQQLTNARVERVDAALDKLIDLAASFTKLGEGFVWAEGPVWIDDDQYLLLSDVPGNRIYKWGAGDGLTVWLDPSGGDGPSKPGFREPGTNGLKLGIPGEILAADHGSRAVAAINLVTKAKRIVVGGYQGKKFNSPNDIAVAADGAVWFTDPPYGLEGLNDSPLKELQVNGVYRASGDGGLVLVESGLTFPNGLAFSPEGKTLYVAVSDPADAVIMALDVSDDRRLSGSRRFADMTEMISEANPGLPDGLAVDEDGNLWATGPGGVHIFSPSGKRLGMLRTGTAIANLVFGGPDGRTLFLASHHMLVSVPVRIGGARNHRPRL